MYDDDFDNEFEDDFDDENGEDPIIQRYMVALTAVCATLPFGAVMVASGVEGLIGGEAGWQAGFAAMTAMLAIPAMALIALALVVWLDTREDGDE